MKKKITRSTLPFLPFAQSLRQLITTLLCIFLLVELEAQTLQGRVFDADSFEPLIGVNVQLGTSGTVTDQVGRFTLTPAVNPGPSDSLRISYVGYQPATVPVNKSNLYNIALKVNEQLLAELVVTGYQQRQILLKTAGAISVLTARDLRRDNETSIAPALNRVPGVYMHSGSLNTNRIVIRGIGFRSLFSTNRVRAYFNDIPLTNGEGETTLEDIDLSLIQRMEILKGPSSSIYGAGLGGTIILESKKPSLTENLATSHTMVGSYGLVRQVNSLQFGSERSRMILSQQTLRSDGYRENNEYNRQAINFLGYFFPDSRTSVTVLANYTRLKAFIPSSIDSILFRENPRAAAANWLAARGFEDYDKLVLGTSVQHDLSNRSQLHGSIFATTRVSEEPRPFNILREANQTYGTRWRYVYQNEESPLRPMFTVGAELFREWYGWKTYQIINNRDYGNLLSDNEEVRTYYNVFASMQWQLGAKWQFTAGVNLNETDYQYTDLFRANGDLSGQYGFETILSPRVAVNFLATPQIALHGSISHGFSPPSLSETLTPQGEINPDIRPETGYNFEIGSRGHLNQRRFFYDLTVYSMQIRNLLVARRTAEDAFVGINAGQSIHRGIELALQYQLVPEKPSGFVRQLQPFLNLNLADYTFGSFIDGESDFSGNQLTGVPQTTVAAGIDGQFAFGIYGNLNYLYTAEIPANDANTVFSDAYQVWNLRLGIRRTVARKLDFDLYGGIQNLGDEKYASMLMINALPVAGRPPRFFYPGLPRNYFAGLSVQYRWQ